MNNTIVQTTVKTIVVLITEVTIHGMITLCQVLYYRLYIYIYIIFNPQQISVLSGVITPLLHMIN